MRNRIIHIIITLTICYLLPTMVQAKKKYNVAVLDIASSQALKANASAIRELLEIRLFKKNIFTIIERNRISVILKEQKFSTTGCTDTGCAVEIGKLLSADLVIVGNFSQIDGYTLSIKLVDVSKGSIIVAEYENIKNKNSFLKSVKKLTNRLVKKSLAKGYNNTVKTLSYIENSSRFTTLFKIGFVNHYNSDYKSKYSQLSFYDKSYIIGFYSTHIGLGFGAQLGYVNNRTETNFNTDFPIRKDFHIIPLLLSMRYVFALNITDTTMFNIIPTLSLGASYLYYESLHVDEKSHLSSKENSITFLLKPGINWGFTFNNAFRIFLGIDFATNMVIDKDIRLLSINLGGECFF